MKWDHHRDTNTVGFHICVELQTSRLEEDMLECWLLETGFR